MDSGRELFSHRIPAEMAAHSCDALASLEPGMIYFVKRILTAVVVFGCVLAVLFAQEHVLLV